MAITTWMRVIIFCCQSGLLGCLSFVSGVECKEHSASEVKSLVQKVADAKSLLQLGVNTWDEAAMHNARRIFLDFLPKGKHLRSCLNYYVALCDYRLATYHISRGDMDKVEYHIKEGQKHLKQCMEIEPEWGEPFALYAALLGFEIAVNPQESMSLAFRINENLGKAFDKEPENPRVNLIKGLSELFTPEQYGGGPEVAIPTLRKSAQLFETEQVNKPMMPSWGKEEAYTFLAMACQRTGDIEKARVYYAKAVAINPDFALAKEELKKLEKEP